jgi:hypothetical protein
MATLGVSTRRHLLVRIIFQCDVVVLWYVDGAEWALVPSSMCGAHGAFLVTTPMTGVIVQGSYTLTPTQDPLDETL